MCKALFGEVGCLPDGSGRRVADLARELPYREYLGHANVLQALCWGTRGRAVQRVFGEVAEWTAEDRLLSAGARRVVFQC